MRIDETTDTPKAIYLKDYAQPAYLTESLDLTVQIFDGTTTVTAKNRLRRNTKNAEPLILNGEKMELVSVRLDGMELKPQAYVLADDSLTIEDVPENFELEIVTKIVPEENTELSGLYKSGRIYCTQCEAEGFRRITYYVDRPDNMATFITRIEADKKTCPILLSNGNRIDHGDLPDGRHYAVWEDPFRKPCYLFALVAGNLAHIEDEFVTHSGRKVALYIYVEPGNEDKCAHAMESLKKSMKWDEDVYGREYDLDLFNIVAVNDFNFGAMENKSLNIFNAKLILASPETATDRDFLAIESVVAHEYFHNWTGNRITCRDWFQLSLKEGLTVFRDQSFSADMNSAAVQRIDDVDGLRGMQFPEDASPLAHPVRPDSYIEINNFYTATVYEKGAEVLRMLHTLLGPENYRKGTDLYFERHDGQAVTCDDFVHCMQDASGTDLSQFKLWYSQAGTPEIEASGAYNDATRRYTLTLKQTVPDTPGQKNKKPMHIPVAVGLLGPNGQDMLDGGTRVLELREAEQSFTFDNISSKPVPSILRGFSAPVKLKADLTDDDLRFLMVHDTDGFNRWDAGQTYAKRILLDLMEDAQAGKDLTLDPAFIESFRLVLEDAATDPALLARALILPDEETLAQDVEEIDIDALCAARNFVRETLSQTLRDGFFALYENNHVLGEYRVTPEDIGRRALKNTALRYLSVMQDPESIALARQQYDAATNMTDRIAALATLADTDTPEREQAFADFYTRFEKNPLVIDKWFALQATADRPDTIETVKMLMDHPAFTFKTPNRLRSLVGAFAAGNLPQFHRKDGAGYTLLADVVIKVNGINPSVAARLLTTLQQWKRYTPDRRAKMKAVLERILGQDNLSPDVFEIASKTLKA